VVFLAKLVVLLVLVSRICQAFSKIVNVIIGILAEFHVNNTRAGLAFSKTSMKEGKIMSIDLIKSEKDIA